MSSVYCNNAECTEYLIAKGNPMDLPPEDIICGGCGMNTEVDASETTPGEPVAP